MSEVKKIQGASKTGPTIKPKTGPTIKPKTGPTIKP